MEHELAMKAREESLNRKEPQSSRDCSTELNYKCSQPDKEAQGTSRLTHSSKSLLHKKKGKPQDKRPLKSGSMDHEVAEGGSQYSDPHSRFQELTCLSLNHKGTSSLDSPKASQNNASSN
jgi:hypothetical protein